METSLTDEILAKRTQAGDRDAFGTLVERYESKLSRYGTKFLRREEDIQDIVQEIFIRAYRNINSFDTNQRFSPWLYRVAHNAFVNELRKKSRTPFFTIDFDALLAHPQSEDVADKDTHEREMKEMVEKGLEALPANSNYREVLILYYMEELSYKEIADVLQVPIGTVGVRVRRAKDALAKAYATMNIRYDF